MTWEEWKKEQAKFRINKIDHQKQRKMDWKKEWLIIFLVTIFFLFVGYVLVILVGNVNAIGIWEIETDKQLAFAGEDITVTISGDIDGYCNLELINESQEIVFTEFISLGDDGNASYTFTAMESWDSGTYILRVFWYDRVLAFTSMDIIYDAEYLQDMRIDELEKKLNDERRLNEVYRRQISTFKYQLDKWKDMNLFTLGIVAVISYFLITKQAPTWIKESIEDRKKRGKKIGFTQKWLSKDYGDISVFHDEMQYHKKKGIPAIQVAGQKRKQYKDHCRDKATEDFSVDVVKKIEKQIIEKPKKIIKRVKR
jgi:hypothetical protein